MNEHNGWVPRDFWLEDWEKQAIIRFHLKNPLEGYRRLTFMMLDADIVAVPLATSRRRTCSPAVSRRSMLSEIGSWRRHENSVRFVGSKPLERRPICPFSVVAHTSKHYAVTHGLASAGHF